MPSLCYSVELRDDSLAARFIDELLEILTRHGNIDDVIRVPGPHFFKTNESKLALVVDQGEYRLVASDQHAVLAQVREQYCLVRSVLVVVHEVEEVNNRDQEHGAY